MGRKASCPLDPVCGPSVCALDTGLAASCEGRCTEGQEQQAQEEAGCPGHSGHFLLLEEGRAACPSEGDSPALRQTRSLVPALPECDPVAIWGCWAYMRVWRERRHGVERCFPGDPGKFCCHRDCTYRA